MTVGTLFTLAVCAEYDLNMERRRADERAKGSQWTRRFPHERGNWPTFVFIAGESTAALRYCCTVVAVVPKVLQQLLPIGWARLLVYIYIYISKPVT